MNTPAKKYGYRTAITPEEIKALGEIQDGDQQWWDNTWHDMRGGHGGIHDPYYPVRRPIDVNPPGPDGKRVENWELVGLDGLVGEGCECTWEGTVWRAIRGPHIPIQDYLKNCDGVAIAVRRRKQVVKEPSHELHETEIIPAMWRTEQTETVTQPDHTPDELDEAAKVLFDTPFYRQLLDVCRCAVTRHLAVVKELKETIQTLTQSSARAAEVIREYQDRVVKAECDSQQWRPVSPDNLPKADVGFELVEMAGETLINNQTWLHGISDPNLLLTTKYTHWLPLPPLPAPQKSEAEECYEAWPKDHSVGVAAEYVIKFALDWAKRKGKE